MGTIANLMTSLLDMNDTQLREKVREIRGTRNVTEKMERKEKKERVKRGIKATNSIAKMFDALSPEEKQQLLSEMGG